MTAPALAVSNNTWRADLRAATARRECDGGRTSCVSDISTTAMNREK
jgi:hypothetical protein